MTRRQRERVPQAVRSAQRRTAHYRRRLELATAPGEQASAAWDWYRSAVAAVISPAARARLQQQIAQVLADHAVAVERSQHGDSE